MITLGVETSCDETAMALVEGRKVLSEEVASSWKRHADLGGVVPEIASRHHLEAILPCLDRVLRKARLGLKDVDLIAVTQGPGLMGSLLVGHSVARSLAMVLNRPLVGVDHVLAHALSGQIGRPRYVFPFMSLVVSGGHTVLIYWRSLERFRIIGRTIDDAAGEAFDKVAKMMGLGYPGGPIIDRLARKGDREKIPLPRPLISEGGYDFSFSGLKTAVLYKWRALTAKNHARARLQADMASSFQESVVDCLVVKTLRAMADARVNTLAVGGGVSANSRLRQKFMAFQGSPDGRMASDELVRKYAIPLRRRYEILFPSIKLSLDNAVMIAVLGELTYRRRRVRGARPVRVYSDFFMEKG